MQCIFLNEKICNACAQITLDRYTPVLNLQEEDTKKYCIGENFVNCPRLKTLIELKQQQINLNKK